MFCIGVGVGGEYDIQARLVARHIGKHIPGNPTVVPQNMTGAGGLRMVNYLYNVAPKDGLSIGMIANASAAMQAAGIASVQFDAGRMQWLGSIAPVVETMAVWSATGVKSIDDIRKREVVAGASARGAITFIYPQMMNEFLGTKFKIVTGYTGGNQINLAMERGEVEARNNTWSSWKATKADWLKDKKITVIAQAGPRAPDLDAPSVEDAARTPDERQLIELVVSGTQFGRPFATNEAPPDRVKALRDAFAEHHERPRVPGGGAKARLRGRSGARREDAGNRRQGAGDAQGNRSESQGIAGVIRVFSLPQRNGGVISRP